ncbi:MAG: type ISP restriction/modification enzyme [Thermoguttaceae bacterium]
MSAFAEYLATIGKEYAAGNATEHTHRSALKTLLESVAKSITAINEPKRILCGSPDFQVVRKTVPIGHVETKDIGINLNEMERGRGSGGEQFVRYRDGLPNWVLTDYLEFRWFVGGKKRLTVRIADLSAKGKIKPLPDGEEQLRELLTAFFDQPALTVATAKELAQRMAGMTRIIRNLIVGTFEHEKERGWLHNWLAAFRDTLIPDIDEKQFADMFAQTMAYGLFAARVHAPAGKPFSREMAAYNLPKTNPFLRKLFAEIGGVDMPDSIVWAVGDIVELLKHADMVEILEDFGKGKGKEDPVVHFYETFLAAYDPKMRKVRGVYYTPEPVVSFIVRSIDYLLKHRFNRAKGLADENTMILDPATGTATFLYFVIDQIHRKFAKQAGAWDSYVAKHLLNRLFGFEILIAPYAVAHLKLGMQLQATGYRFDSDQRLGIYLTNTLEEAAQRSEHIFANWVAEEANFAAEIKRDKPILVILGNPPYSNYGRMNRGDWILALLDDYKRNLNEKKINLDDDFIKFIRFAQWRIERTGEGIVGFITNNTYLDGLTHRRMRECLMETFNEIYVLNLHGSTMKNESAPGGSKDQSVFDITIGTSIVIFVKLPKTNRCRVFHADLWGDRESKYHRLARELAPSTAFVGIEPSAPNFFFIPIDLSGKDEYKAAPSVVDIFPAYGCGFATSRDDFVTDMDADVLAARIQSYFQAKVSDDELAEKFGIRDYEGFSVAGFRRNHVFDRKNIRRFFYRPFDERYVYYAPFIVQRSQKKIMQHQGHTQSLAMATTRFTKGETPCHFFATRLMVEKISLSNKTSNNAFAFPLYLQEDNEGSQRSFVENDKEQENLSKAFLQSFTSKLDVSLAKQKAVTPEDIFHYAYAVFHSPTYRMRYAEFLKIDFPRLPLTSNMKLFKGLATKGEELVAFHLLESPNVEEFLTDWPVKGDNVVEGVAYVEEGGRVSINKTQYFGGVPKVVWGIPHRRLSGMPKMAQGPQGPETQLR